MQERLVNVRDFSARKTSEGKEFQSYLARKMESSRRQKKAEEGRGRILPGKTDTHVWNNRDRSGKDKHRDKTKQ